MASRSRQQKDALYAQLAVAVKALANPHRLEHIELLAQAPRTVEVLAGMSGLSLANASQHLQVLRAAGLVVAEKAGSFVTYQLAGADVANALVSVREMAHARARELAQRAQDLQNDADAAEPVDRRGLLKRVRSGEVVVLDVRPEDEFVRGHLPGAVSIPLAQLRQRLKEIPKSKDVVAYCRGPYCVLAVEAVNILRASGARAARLHDGIAEWRSHGLPVVTPPAAP
jgi:rhodanese-related sulfurtransferase/DNA-binding transcriptional ArsR family regulator